MAKLVIDPVVRGEDGKAARGLAQRLNRFQNKNTWWRHGQNGTMDQFDAKFDEAVANLRATLGKTHPLVIDGREVKTKTTFSTQSPADASLVIGKWAAGTPAQARDAIAAAKRAFPSWSALPWPKRVAIIEKAADLYTKRFYDLCAAMCLEAGKSRYEASIDVDEAIDFLRYYALTMREMDGFDVEMGKPFPNESCRSIRKPWGVFAVVCPFNFPVAITTGMTAAALLMGNTAILKPSNKGLLSGWTCYQLFREAGVPGDALQFLTAADHGISSELLEAPEVDGLVFTGSKAVGMRAWQAAATHGRPKPMVAEMGGKNAILVSDKADLDKAVQGVFKSAFGYSGQKCSACSRVYVHKRVAKEFIARLSKLTDAAKVGAPWAKESYMGPVIEARKVELLREVVAQTKKDGGAILAGGKTVRVAVKGKALAGNYVRPTIVGGLPLDHRAFREEFFMPFVAVAEVPSFDAGLAEVNAVEYGLTAGCFSEDKAEVRKFFVRAQAGVLYANRAAGGSTAAVVNGQSFVGWKWSGSTGNGAGGRYYLLQFSREQSQTTAR